MKIDGYEITSILDTTRETWAIIVYVPSQLDNGILQQIKANGFGYVDDNIPVLD